LRLLRPRQARELADDPLRHRGREERLAGGDGANRRQQLFRRVVLEDEAARARLQRLVDVLVEVEGRKHEDPRRRVGVENPPRRLEPVELRHPNVHQDHRRAKPGGLVDSFEPVLRLRDDLDVRLLRKQHPEAGPHHRLIVRDEYADVHERRSARGSRAERTKPPPFAGPADISPP
jgi:hypothetical protein